MQRGRVLTPFTEAGELLSNEKPQWREVRFLTQALGGGGSTLKTLDLESLGCQGFQVPVPMPVPLSRPVLNTHQTLP